MLLTYNLHQRHDDAGDDGDDEAAQGSTAQHARCGCGDPFPLILLYIGVSAYTPTLLISAIRTIIIIIGSSSTIVSRVMGIIMMQQPNIAPPSTRVMDALILPP
jgi:hypothetical protein